MVGKEYPELDWIEEAVERAWREYDEEYIDYHLPFGADRPAL